MQEYDYPVHQPLKEIMMRFFLQLLPTALVVFFLLWNAEYQVAFLKGKSLILCIASAVGMLGSIIVYQTRLRFLPSFFILILLGIGSALLIRKMGAGDIESFFLAHRFKLYFTMFCIGWFIGFGLMRIRFFPTILALILVGVGIWMTAITQQSVAKEDYWNFLLFLIPVILYGAYIIYISEQLKDYHKYGGKGTLKMLINALFFTIIISIALGILIQHYKSEIQQTVDDLTIGKYEEKHSMLQKSEDGTSIKDRTSLSNDNHRENELLLAVYIDNFFENSDIPNPLYLTSFYYARYDTTTETFEIANDMPDQDLFRPDLRNIPLYQTKTDSSVLDFTGNNPSLKTVEIEVYNKGMTFADFVAPTTAFSVQPIAVDAAYQKEYKSAYLAKSVVNELNSAYFVYNSNNPQAVKFQNARYDILRKVTDFSQMDSIAYRYYTELPNTESLREVRGLALKLAQGKETPIDKIIAIKDYFLSKDESGRPLFQYSDNPGVPDIPSTKNLNYFLFENRKGFCAHYAGATLFLLRSLGIPSRITAGFLVEDRSTTNTGWYYLYADQVHAWVQVYFPGYGWLDFDTTVGNDEARESDQPDGTPPLEPKKATLTFSGVISDVDTNKKTLSIDGYAATFYDQNYTTQELIEISLDISIARIIRDTNTLSMYELKEGDTLAAVSYGKAWSQHKNSVSDMTSLLRYIEKPIPIDLIQVRPERKSTSNAQEDQIQNERFKWSCLIIPFSIILFLFLIIQLIPLFIKKYFLQKSKSKNYKRSAYYNHLLIQYYLWMMKIKKNRSETMSQFAQRMDHRYGTTLKEFITEYQKLKYADPKSSIEHQEILTSYGREFVNTMDRKIPAKTRRRNWLFVKRALRFVVGRSK